ncbi:MULTISPECIES: hypothetical protein [unclassified Paraburkholderia]|uniref:hypothetical protein n=1 Tax=unclassified Paraburkholderia TaxID=2615204 RepID=UPI0038BDCF5A
MTDGSPALAPDREIVGREPDGFTGTQADFSFGDYDNAAPSVRERLEHADLVSALGQPELRFERLSRNRTGDLAAMPGEAKRNCVSVRREIWQQVDNVHDFHLLNSAANL